MGRFILIDHSLIDYSGHHYEYARAVLDAAAEAGLRPVLLANRRFKPEREEAWPIIPAYKYGVWLHQGLPRWQIALFRRLMALQRKSKHRSSEASQEVLSDNPTRGPNLLRSYVQYSRQAAFIRDTVRTLLRLDVTDDDLIFVPTLSYGDFAALRRLWRMNYMARQPCWHLLFRRPPVTDRAWNDAIRTVSSSEPTSGSRPRRIRFWADSEELAANYAETTGIDFGTLPIPHAGSLRDSTSTPERLRILFLGDARLEKGFQHLPQLVRSLTDDDGNPQRFEFYFQSHRVSPCEEPEITAARAELSRLASRGVTLFTSPLGPGKYRELLASGHLVVLPYDRRAYAERSSGVFAEALAAGIPSVVPAGTWMARRMPAGAGRVCHTPENAARQIVILCADYKAYENRARSIAKSWSEEHNAGLLVSSLRAREGDDSPQTDSEVAHRTKVSRRHGSGAVHITSFR